MRRRVIKGEPQEVYDDNHAYLQNKEATRSIGEVHSVKVSYNEEVYSSVQYNSFRVGGHSITLTPNVGESVEECAARGFAILKEFVDAEFVHRLESFRARLKTSASR